MLNGVHPLIVLQNLWLIVFILMLWLWEYILLVKNRLVFTSTSYVLYWVNPTLVQLVLTFLFKSNFLCSLFVFIMNKLIVFSSWINSKDFSIFILRWSWHIVLFMMRINRCNWRSVWFVNLTNSICLSWSSSWNLSYFLCWFWESRVNFVMIAILSWLLRLV